MSLARRLTVAGALALTEAAGFLMLLAAPRTEGIEDLGLALAICFVFGVPFVGMKAARRLASAQRSNAPGYLTLAVNLLYAYYDAATEDSRPAIALVVCGAVFVAAFLGTYSRAANERSS